MFFLFLSFFLWCSIIFLFHRIIFFLIFLLRHHFSWIFTFSPLFHCFHFYLFIHSFIHSFNISYFIFYFLACSLVFFSFLFAFFQLILFFLVSFISIFSFLSYFLPSFFHYHLLSTCPSVFLCFSHFPSAIRRCENPYLLFIQPNIVRFFIFGRYCISLWTLKYPAFSLIFFFLRFSRKFFHSSFDNFLSSMIFFFIFFASSFHVKNCWLV